MPLVFNDTSRCLDDILIFTIYIPEFDKYIQETYQPELRLNKANATSMDIPFLDLKMEATRDVSIFP